MKNKYITWIAVLDGNKALLLTKGLNNRLEILDHAFEERYINTNHYKKHLLEFDLESNDNFSENHIISNINEDTKVKKQFIQGVAEYLESCLWEYDRLILAAPPSALTELLNELSKAVKNKIVLEIDEDFVKLAPYQIRQNLENLIPIF